MIVSESNRVQSSAPPAFERKPAAESVVPEKEAARVAEPMLAQPHDPIHLTSMVVSGATMGAIAGIGTLVLAVVGLSGVAPAYLAPIAVVMLGLAFLLLGGIDLAWFCMFNFAESESREHLLFRRGVVIALVAGLAGVILGLLNLVFFIGAWFTAIAVIVLGVGLLAHSAAMRHIARFTYCSLGFQHSHSVLNLNAVSLAPTRDLIVGLGGVVLGILALLGIMPMTLGFVALLAMGLAVAATASTVCGATLATLDALCPASVRA
jgi:hypothetical protein